MMRARALQLFLLCAALSSAYAARSFGTGLSSNRLYTHETPIYNYSLSATAKMGTTTHFWATGSPAVAVDTAIWRYYIDGETTPSIVYVTTLFSGVGFDDPVSPWANSVIGKGAHSGGLFSNMRIPFARSIRLTGQIDVNSVPNGTTSCVLYVQVRGAEDLPIVIGDYVLPTDARLHQTVLNGYVAAPLEYVPLMSVPDGEGLLYMIVQSVQSSTPFYIEGCHRMFTSFNSTEWPAMIVSTGMEDYFDSAFTFNGGPFHFEISGLTHFLVNSNTAEMSAYRIHQRDPIFFNNGGRFVWRNGDALDDQNRKCLTQSGGNTIGNPQPNTMHTYGFAYVWNRPQTTSGR